ncbi:MAG: PIN domain-containing protein [Spirochaetales bacterium]|nr:PIN domain-containing protein [Spirochaetales bacterium]
MSILCGHYALPRMEWWRRAVRNFSLQVMDLTPEISHSAVALAWSHRDPADRWIVSTALFLGAVLCTKDKKMARSGLVAIC